MQSLSGASRLRHLQPQIRCFSDTACFSYSKRPKLNRPISHVGREMKIQERNRELDSRRLENEAAGLSDIKRRRRELLGQGKAGCKEFVQIGGRSHEGENGRRWGPGDQQLRLESRKGERARLLGLTPGETCASGDEPVAVEEVDPFSAKLSAATDLLKKDTGKRNQKKKRESHDEHPGKSLTPLPEDDDIFVTSARREPGDSESEGHSLPCFDAGAPSVAASNPLNTWKQAPRWGRDTYLDLLPANATPRTKKAAEVGKIKPTRWRLFIRCSRNLAGDHNLVRRARRREEYGEEDPGEKDLSALATLHDNAMSSTKTLLDPSEVPAELRKDREWHESLHSPLYDQRGAIRQFFKRNFPRVKVPDIFIPHEKPYVVLISFTSEDDLNLILKYEAQIKKLALDFLPGSIETFEKGK